MGGAPFLKSTERKICPRRSQEALSFSSPSKDAHSLLPSQPFQLLARFPKKSPMPWDMKVPTLASPRNDTSETLAMMKSSFSALNSWERESLLDLIKKGAVTVY